MVAPIFGRAVGLSAPADELGRKLALLIRDSLPRRNLGQRYANQDLSLHGVTLPVSVGLIRSHVSHRDPSGPRE